MINSNMRSEIDVRKNASYNYSNSTYHLNRRCGEPHVFTIILWITANRNF
jgi:hypothetical protein